MQCYFIIPVAVLCLFYTALRGVLPALFLFFNLRASIYLFASGRKLTIYRQHGCSAFIIFEFLFINQHGLALLPLRPGFFGDRYERFSSWGVKISDLRYARKIAKIVLLIKSISLCSRLTRPARHELRNCLHTALCGAQLDDGGCR